MRELVFYNTLGGERESFRPADPGHVTIYVCGPTVYDFAHLGNARPAVVFDVLVRLLRRRFARVTYARNITDIDDKIIARAATPMRPKATCCSTCPPLPNMVASRAARWRT
jgi:cysteinyl-tRNA synthetase